MNIPVDKIFIFNCPYSIERRKNVLNWINKLEIPKNKYQFIYTTKMPDSFIEYSKEIMKRGFYDDIEKNTNNKYLYNAVFSLALNHYWTIKTSYEFGYRNIWLMEDDCCFIDDLNLIEYTLNNIPNDYKIIKWSLQYWVINEAKSYSYITDNWFEKNNKIQEFKRFNEIPEEYQQLRGCGSSSYMLDRNGMELLISLYNNQIDCSDNIFWKIKPEDIFFTKYRINFDYAFDSENEKTTIR